LKWKKTRHDNVVVVVVAYDDIIDNALRGVYFVAKRKGELKNCHLFLAK